MRLEKIKLAGFKSFVDPTTVHIPSNLVGIVGPNGCGKSNVIDAVRWVMGESSAKMLRGESMADVIFNGSTSRKPVGTASIELVFDNSDGKAGGQYAQYSTISVKRQVSRDGQSNYLMNGVRCRRRDITDLFLGTGLGPRSYSIIEQGMISRLIEARPEDLRAFLEEAAGISKYKERRRDTENRIRRTKENLDRLNDLREEIAKQLQHLQRQANTAERYKEYKEQERRLQAELLALRWRAMDEDIKRRDKEILEKETDLEAAIAKQRRLEAEIERDRSAHTEANDNFNEVQGRFYAVGSEIARLEQSIQYAKESRAQFEHDLHQTEQAWQESSDHRQQDEARLAELNANLAEQEPLLEQAREIEQESVARLAEAEQAMQAWQNEWEQFNHQAAEPAQTAQVERTRINHLDEKSNQTQRRLERFTEELERLNDPQLMESIENLELQEQEREEQAALQQEKLAEAAEKITTLRQQNQVAGQLLDEARAALQTARGRYASLEALQQAALGKQEQAVTEWLETQELGNASRLAQEIEVEDGWQQAVETVLGFHLQSVCSDGLANLESVLDTLKSGSLSLFDTSVRAENGPATADALSRRIQSPWPLESLLAGVRTADNLAQAYTLRDSLKPGESVITPDGVWLGRNWLRLNRGEDETSGVLAREQEIRQLGEQIEQLLDQVAQTEATLADGREQLRMAEQEKEQAQKQLDEIKHGISELRSQLAGKRTRAEHLKQRGESIQREMEELRAQAEQDREELELSRARLHAALEEMETLSERRERLVEQRESHNSLLSEIREETARQRNQSHSIALQIESMRSSQASLTQSLERMRGQLAHLTARREELKQSLEEGQEPLLEKGEELERQLALRVEVEAELAKARTTLEEIDARVRRMEQERSACEQEVIRQRTSMDQARMARQEVLIRCKTLEEQLKETGFQREQLFLELPGEATIETWQQNVEQMEARIRRLGPINLAAIDEFQEQSERMNYLDAQHADVTESLETLENAIRKIDRETRTRFKETFDKVNSGLQEKFPKLFGGGHAYLQLTGEDLLDTGVTVMARPPGKRNSSIHLLSGGEKALTAVALVFAIFELNPAPFCMLDEVDAPLDDANVGRFCELVKSMSEQVQFIFISHNKLTMEIANQLTGVTMHEPGVSRLVSVDISEAAELAAM
ncbi:chromosome segregation protein SMC [Sedimenticola thiotaurini]|uniref:Chromosome partition protein Smc n=1 Tax=Sedimenticola thiotaurini TaxID=1543721 RepID=A0A0F7JSX8_9GAMM|nr:chromosome segregation protein SMC [Sedimenticola thiotaurini]AKH19556.1 chromosome segregation protein SMC [Sedimenticola thiotaurini]